MLVELFKKLENSKWLRWVGTAPFIIFPLFIMINGEMWRGIGILAFFASVLLGIVLGNKIAWIFTTHVKAASEAFRKRLSTALSAFGFLFLPPVVGNWSNTYLGTEIEMHSLGVHFVWACAVGVIAFYVKPSS